jgi:rubrerythrin
MKGDFSMSYTTNGIPQKLPLNMCSLLREGLVGEIVAIDAYERHMAQSANPEFNRVWSYILKREKIHYGIFLDLIREYDLVEYEEYLSVKEKLHVKKGSTKKCILRQDDSLLNMIREDIKGECEAILLYEKHLSMVNIPKVRKALEGVIRDEKRHVEMLTLLLLNYDKDSYGPISVRG